MTKEVFSYLQRFFRDAERIEEMVYYAFSEEGSRLSKETVERIAEGLLEGKSDKEIYGGLGISENTFCKYLYPGYREQTRKDNADYKRRKRKADLVFIDKERVYQKNYREKHPKDSPHSNYLKRFFKNAERIEKMISYAASDKGSSLNMEIVSGISKGLLEGKTNQEIYENLGLNRNTFYRYIDPEFREKQKEYQRNKWATDPEYREKQNACQKGCPIACLWKEKEVREEVPLTEFLTYDELLRRKRELGIKGNLKGTLRNWVITGIITEVNDVGTKRYAIDFSSPLFEQLDNLE